MEVYLLMIEINQLKKTYKKTSLCNRERIVVLEDITFKVNTGDCLGIIGGSGNGKSTLSRIILNLETCDSGSVTIDGIPHVTWLSKNPGRFNIIFQDYRTSVNPNWKIKKIIEEPLYLCKIHKGDYQKNVLQILEKVGLTKEILDQYPHELSGGQLQRVCIARALITRSKYLILDEAISSLDVVTQSQIIDLLIELKKIFQLTYIFISHDLKAVSTICNRVIFLHEGKIIEEVDCNQLSEVKTDYARTILQSALVFHSDFNNPKED